MEVKESLGRNDHNDLPLRVEKIKNLKLLGAQIVVGLNASSATIQEVTSLLPENPTMFESKRALGMSEHWSKLQNLATGNYIRYWFSGDDIEIDCLVEQVKQLRAKPHVSLAFSPRKIRLASKPLPAWLSSQKAFFGPVSKELDDSGILESVLRSGSNPVGEPSFVTFRKSKMPISWPLERGYVVDLAMYKDCLRAGNVLWLPYHNAGSFGVSQESGSFDMAKRQLSDFTMLVSDWKGRPLKSGENFRMIFRSALRQMIYLIFFRRAR